MAIFYNHIKGCGANSTGATDSTKDLWTWISFAATGNDGLISTNEDLKANNKHSKFLPTISISKSNDKNSAFNFGNIITSDATYQAINTEFYFNSHVNVAKGCLVKWPGGSIAGFDDEIQIEAKETLTLNAKDITVSGSCNIDDVVTIDDTQIYGVSIAKPTKIDTCLYVGADADNLFKPNTTEAGTIKAEHKCEALYFNATSDRRAKSNITPVQFSALSVVNKLPVYTFQYLNVEEPVIGLIAQEAAGHNLDGFNMVTNLDASGEFGDFMQMKESKLVYVLWKAIQELSAEVEELKAEIRNLK